MEPSARQRIGFGTIDAMGLFPLFLKLSGRRCLVVGAGPVGESKIAGLLLAGTRVQVVAPRATPQIRAWARTKKIEWKRRGFERSDLDKMFLVVAATSSGKLHEKIFREARRRGVLCNVVDDPLHCDFYYPAVVHRGALQIAISTSGRSPALAQRLKKVLERQFGEEYEAWIKQLGRARKKLFSQAIDPAERRKLLHHQASEESYQAFRSRRGATGRGRKSS